MISKDALHLRAPGFAETPLQQQAQETRIDFKPRKDLDAVQISIPIDWSMNPYRDDNWQLHLNSFRMIDPFIDLYEESGDKAILGFMFDLMFDWHRYHIEESNDDHEFANNDMAVGIRMTRLGYLIDRFLCGEIILDPASVRKIAEILLFHWRLFISDEFLRMNNHGISVLHGLVALVRVVRLDAEVHQRWLAIFSDALNGLVNSQYDARGFHRENSPQYHFFALKLFQNLFKSGWYDEIQGSFHDRLEAAIGNGSWMKFPDGRIIPIGDSSAQAPNKIGHLDLRKPPSVDSAVEVLSHDIYGMVRRTSAKDAFDWSLLAVKSGIVDRMHRQEDSLSYVWSESGHDLITDPGKYAYTKDDPMRIYVRTTRAHNTIEFGKGKQKAHMNAPLPVIEKLDWGWKMSGSARFPDPDITHYRDFYFVPGRALLIVDSFHCDTETDFTHWTHFAPEFRISDDRSVITDRHGNKVFISAGSSCPLKYFVERGKQAPRIQGWVSREYLKAEPVDTLGAAGRASRAVMAVVFTLGAKAALELTEDHLIRWSFEEIDCTLSPPASPKPQ